MYDFKFIYLAENYELGDGGDINWNLGFMLVNHPYNKRTDRIADPLEYDVLTSEDMKEMAKVVGDTLHLRAFGPLLF